jgi:acetyl/propionyl-CoA carboxylase alpha subunit
LNKILVANRGEIAVRIIRACREMGIATVAVYSECDRTALHVRLADEAWAIGPNPPRESYLHVEIILRAARETGADAVHPGYGFLAENEEFAKAVVDRGLTLSVRRRKRSRSMGRQDGRASAARRAGVPLVPGTRRSRSDVSMPKSTAGDSGLTAVEKAVSGGGGKACGP